MAYIMSRFPKLTETFILFEILAVEQQGISVEVFPLQREPGTVMHPEARAIVERAHFEPWLAARFAGAHLRFLRRDARRYLGTLWTLLRANWGSLRFWAGAVSFFPKAVYLAEQMERQGIAHIHAHFASHPAMVAFAIHRLTGIPYSFTAHGSDLHVDQHMLCEKVDEAAFVVTISQYNRELIADHCGEGARERVRVIHCGVDTTVFAPTFAAPRAPDAPFTLLMVGTLHEVKGQPFLIEGCRLLHEQGLNFSCLLVGDGPDQAALQQQIERAGLSARVHLVGRKTRDEIAALLQQADVLVAPSVPTQSGRREGIPVVLMEAMAAGLPVVASDLSGIPELVRDGENGLLVPPRDSVALAAALARLAASPALRERLGRAGRATVEQAFDLTANSAQLAAHFARALHVSQEQDSATTS